MYVIWVSRDPMSKDQIADCKAILGDCSIEQLDLTWTDVESVRTVADECSILIGVFPQALAFRLGWLNGQWAAGADEDSAWTNKIWTAESRPIAAKDGEPRRFEHCRFVGANGMEVAPPGYNSIPCPCMMSNYLVSGHHGLTTIAAETAIEALDRFRANDLTDRGYSRHGLRCDSETCGEIEASVLTDAGRITAKICSLTVAYDGTPIYCRYAGRARPQPTYIQLDDEGNVSVGYSGELGDTVPAVVRHKQVLRWRIPAAARPDAITELIERKISTLDRVHAGHSVDWDGSNYVGSLTADAQAAREEFALASCALESECLAVWDHADWWADSVTIADAAVSISLTSSSVVLSSASTADEIEAACALIDDETTPNDPERELIVGCAVYWLPKLVADLDELDDPD